LVLAWVLAWVLETLQLEVLAWIQVLKEPLVLLAPPCFLAVVLSGGKGLERLVSPGLPQAL
jgi:hypothetical protein